MVTIGIVPLLMVGILSIAVSRDLMQRDSIAAQQDNVRQGARYIDLVMDDVESLIANLSGIEELNTELTNRYTDTPYDRLLAQEKIGYILNNYSNLKGLVSIDLFTAAGNHYHVGETLDVTAINEELKDRLANDASADGDFIYWSGIEANINPQSGYRNVITAAKAFGGEDGAPGAGVGLIVVSYDPSVLDGEMGRGVEGYGYTIAVDARDRIIYHPDSAYIGRTLSGDLASRMTGKTDGQFQMTVDGDLTMVVFEGTQKGGWKVARFISLDSLFSRYNFYIFFIVALLVVAATVILHYGIVISRQVAQPIRMITQTFRSLRDGDLEHAAKLGIKPGDEVGELGALFNSFIEAQQDISTQKKLEKRLNQQNHELNEALVQLKAAQTRLVQQEKLAGIGQLAAGVAHEINNPLGFVIANTGVIRKYTKRIRNFTDAAKSLIDSEGGGLDPGGCLDALRGAWEQNAIEEAYGEIGDIFSDVTEGLRRIESIVIGLKSFSRTNMTDERGAYDMNEGIRTTLLIANNELKYSCDVAFEAGALPPVEANGGQINQVVLNILLNAVQAIQSKYGKGRGHIRILTFADGGYACCEIHDDGCGMSEDVLNRVFEPFFTTKPVGQGTGLGLGIAYDIVVNKHVGKLEAESAPGEGSCFKISLPVLRERGGEEDLIEEHIVRG